MSVDQDRLTALLRQYPGSPVGYCSPDDDSHNAFQVGSVIGDQIQIPVEGGVRTFTPRVTIVQTDHGLVFIAGSGETISVEERNLLFNSREKGQITRAMHRDENRKSKKLTGY